MQSSTAVFAFSVLDQKHPFWATLVQKIKIVTLSRNLVPRLIGICRIQWWFLLFLFFTRIILFGKLGKQRAVIVAKSLPPSPSYQFFLCNVYKRMN